jgi:hypothetical protein
MASETEQLERDLLQQVLAGFAGLDRDARLRILRTVATYYELDTLPATPPQRDANAHGRPSPTREPVFSGHAAQSPKEFLFDKAPQTDVERIACLAYYLSHYREQPHFKTAELTKLNTEAAQRKFTNAAYAVNNATQSGYLAAAPSGQKQLTALGEQYVAALPDRHAARAVVERFRARRARRPSRHSQPE